MHYLEGPWSGESAVNLYNKVIAPALATHHGKKRQYNTLEDNDPTGYKSKVAKDAEADSQILPIEFPTCSPDLNPCDFSL